MIHNLPNALDQLLASTYSETQPGAAVLISVGGETLYEKGFGVADLATGAPVTPDTTFRLASVSKQFTAASVQLLEQRGLLSYEDNLLTFFPQFNPVGSQITLRHLLTHTSGLPDYEDFVAEKPGFQVTDEEVLAIAAAQAITYFKPGTRYRYSNTGFVLLALVVEQMTGIGYGRFLEENIFGPFGMHNSRLYGNNKTIVNRAMGYARGTGGEAVFADQGTCTATKGDGCIYTSVRDYLQWHKALSRESGIAPVLDDVFYPVEGYQNGYYGMGWFFARRSTGSLEMYHTGNTSGFSNLVIRIPENDVLMAYFSNIADNPHLLTGFLHTLQQFPLLRPESVLVRDLLKLTR